MAACPICGEFNSRYADYCKKCGAKLYKIEETGLEKLRYDYTAQSIWIRRLLAYLIDSAIVSIIMLLLSFLAYVPLLIGSIFNDVWNWRGIGGLPFIIGLGKVMYFTVMESMYKATFGKQILGLCVEKEGGGYPSLQRSLIRNISKIHFLLLLTDVFLGLYLSSDPRDKYSERVSGTYVVRGRGSVINSDFRIDGSEFR